MNQASGGGREVSDFRFFIRSIIRHSDLVTSEASFEYLKNEGERLLLESLDELEVAVMTSKYKTDCNHIFLNFVPAVTMNPQKIAEDVEKNFVIRYAHRFLKLRASREVIFSRCPKIFDKLHSSVQDLASLRHR